MAIYFRTPNGNVRQASAIHMNVGNNIGEKRIQNIYYGIGAGKVKQIFEGDTVALLNANYNSINNISLNQKEIPTNATLVVSHPNSRYKIYAVGNITGINNNGFGNLYYANLYTKAKKIEIVNPENNYKLNAWYGFRNSSLSYCIENIIFNGCTLPTTNIFYSIKELYGNADKFKCYIIGKNNATLNLGAIKNGPNLYGNLKLKAQNIATFYGTLLNSNNVNFFADLEISNSSYGLTIPTMSINKGDINLKFNNINSFYYITLLHGSYQNFALTLNWDVQNFSLKYTPVYLPAWIRIYSNFKLISNEAKIYLNCKKILDFTYSNTRMHFLGPYTGSTSSSSYYYNFNVNFSSNFNNRIYIYCNNFTIANKIMQKTLYGLNYSYYSSTSNLKRNIYYLESFSPVTDAEIYRPDDTNKTQPYFGNGDYGAYRSNRVGIYILYDYLE